MLAALCRTYPCFGVFKQSTLSHSTGPGGPRPLRPQCPPRHLAQRIGAINNFMPAGKQVWCAVEAAREVQVLMMATVASRTGNKKRGRPSKATHATAAGRRPGGARKKQ
ncbi:hypothetical protein ABBQ32_006975 [Trebouxia sp. C0010 RCD-2024]